MNQEGKVKKRNYATYGCCILIGYLICGIIFASRSSNIELWAKEINEDSATVN